MPHKRRYHGAPWPHHGYQGYHDRRGHHESEEEHHSDSSSDSEEEEDHDDDNHHGDDDHDDRLWRFQIGDNYGGYEYL